MSFLVKNDLYSAIKVDELEVLIEDSPNGEADLEATIAAVMAEIGSYIGHRYDTALAFIDVKVYATGDEYNTDEVIVLIADNWQALEYGTGDLVSRNGKIWNATGDTETTDEPGVAAVWAEAGDAKAFYKSLDDTNIELPVDGLAWEKIADPRNPLLFRMAVDMSLYELYARINPRQIPEHRVKKHDDAVDYLKRAADPRKNVTIEGLELVDHGSKSGTDITWNSNEKISHSW
jgi:hypothetical protein